MNYNVGMVGRILRIPVGSALIGASLLGYISTWDWIGLLPLVTGVFCFCPGDQPLGLSTCPSRAAGPRT